MLKDIKMRCKDFKMRYKDFNLFIEAQSNSMRYNLSAVYTRYSLDDKL